MSAHLVIAIDGPAGAGKSTAARNLAKRLGLAYLDTGASFRAMALKALRSGVDPDDEAAVAALAEETEIAFAGERLERVLLDGEDVSEAIRDEAVARASSRVAVHPALRERLVALWRRYGERRDLVLEGRDIGTVVFPDADLKFFLDARQEVRAQRRFAEHRTEEGVTLDGVQRDLEARDETDRSRRHAPLKRAPNAVLVDTSELTPDETLERLLDEARARLSVD